MPGSPGFPPPSFYPPRPGRGGPRSEDETTLSPLCSPRKLRHRGQGHAKRGLGRRVSGGAVWEPGPSPSPAPQREDRRGAVPAPTPTHLLLNELQQRAPVHRAGPGSGPGSAEAGRGCSADGSAPPLPVRSACSARRAPHSKSRHGTARPAHTPPRNARTSHTDAPSQTHALGRNRPPPSSWSRCRHCARAPGSRSSSRRLRGRLSQGAAPKTPPYQDPWRSLAAFPGSSFSMGRPSSREASLDH